MSQNAVADLVQALERFMETGKPAARTRARTLRSRQKNFPVAPQASPAGVRCTFSDGQRSSVFVMRGASNAAPRLLSECTCLVGPKAQPCGHALSLAQVLAEYAERARSTWMAPMVEAFETQTAAAQLARLDLLLGPQTPARRSSTSELHWLFTLRRNGQLDAELRVRDRLVSGKLGKAKVVGNTRYPALLRESPHPQDRLVARRFVSTLRLGSQAFRAHMAELLEMLAGRPDVHLGVVPQPVRIAVEPVTLRMRETGTHVVIEAVVGGIVLRDRDIQPDGAIIIADPRRERINVARPEEHLLAFITGLGDEPLELPAEFAPRVVDRLREVAADVALELPPDFSPANTPADERLRLSITKERDNWIARLLVRPIAGGAEFAPGEGHARVNATVEGEWLTTIRRLDDERAGAERLVEELELGIRPPAWTAVLPLDALLELAARLKGRQDVLIEWPRNAPRLLSSRATLKVQVDRKRDWFGIEGSAIVESAEVTLAQLLTARRRGTRFIEVGADRFIDLAQVFDERLQRLADSTRVERGSLLLSPAVAPDAPELLDGIDELETSADWEAFAERVRAVRSFVPTVPASLAATPRDYQTAGFQWMRRLAELGQGACLADDMGLGKTLQSIMMLLDRASDGPALVVAPTSVAFNWEREIRRFAPSLEPIHLRSGKRRKLVAEAGPHQVVLATWGLLRRESELLASRTWHTLVLDEAQTIKNWQTDTARAARALDARWRVALTGTPVENHLGELYSILETVVPGLFGSWEGFQNRFATPIERARDTKVQAALVRLIKPFLLRRTKAQVASELPERTEIRLDVQLSRLERQLYEAARVDAVQAMAVLGEGPTGRFHVLAALTRLRQLACSAHLVDPAAPKLSSKTRILLEQVEALIAEERACLVFSQFTRQLELVSEALDEREISHLTLTGETPAREREKLVDRFQNGEAKVFLISLRAGGTGLNLTRAETVFLLDPWWNPAVEDQAADRAHRIGQTRRVTVVRLVALGTIEEKVVELHHQKRELIRGVVGEADVAAALSTTELIDLMQEGIASDDVLEEDGEEPDSVRRLTTHSDVWTHGQVLDTLHEAWARKLEEAVVSDYESSIRLIFAASNDSPAPLPQLLKRAVDAYMPYTATLPQSTNQARYELLDGALTELVAGGHLTESQKRDVVARMSTMRMR